METAREVTPRVSAITAHRDMAAIMICHSGQRKRAEEAQWPQTLSRPDSRRLYYQVPIVGNRAEFRPPCTTLRRRSGVRVLRSCAMFNANEWPQFFCELGGVLARLKRRRLSLQWRILRVCSCRP